MTSVRDQYDAFPYPERDPADEARRLITGSPSLPVEIDHFLFGGQRDWTWPLRALVAGGGTGDGLIQLAQLLTKARRPYEITYLDLSPAARAVAEARAQVRGLTGIRFLTGSLLDAPDHGPFDYIDCCGVLHHLPDPDAGFAALAAALAPHGGLGFMVYAPLGRAGVYPLQAAFNALLGHLPPEEKLAKARALFETVPEGHPFRRNPHLGDHLQSDAGFFDLLLHSQDIAMDVPDLLARLTRAGLDLVSFTEPGHYDLSRFCEAPEGMDRTGQMALAEQLDGTIKVHVGYAARAGRGVTPARGPDAALIPHLKGGQAAPLARQIAAKGQVTIKLAGRSETLHIPKTAAKPLSGIDGRRSLGDLAKGSDLEPAAFAALWATVEAALLPWGLLHYSAINA